jgi:hypothetical protein
MREMLSRSTFSWDKRGTENKMTTREQMSREDLFIEERS